MWVLHVSCSRNPAKWVIYHTVEGVYSSPHLLKPPMWRISVRNIQCLVTLKMKQCLLIFTEPNPPTQPHLPVVLAWQREGDFCFGFSAGGQSFLGCGIRGDVAMFPLPRSSTLPSSLSGMASSAFHLPWEMTAAWLHSMQRSMQARDPANDAWASVKVSCRCRWFYIRSESQIFLCSQQGWYLCILSTCGSILLISFEVNTEFRLRVID